MKKAFYYLLFSVLFFTSCHNLKYISREYEIPMQEIEQYTLKGEDYKLQSYDYLYIRVKSVNEEINELYNTISTSNANNNNQTNFFLTGYMVSDSGYIFLPTIGELYVKGMTIVEAEKFVQSKFEEFLIDPVVQVRLTSFNVTFLGEVNKQGRIPYYKQNINILEAVGSVGGVNSYGDRKKVKVIRPVDSVMVVYELDLTNKNIISTKDFYVYPNDIIYVPPKKTKIFFDFYRDYSTVITIITSTITTTLLIMQLTKS